MSNPLIIIIDDFGIWFLGYRIEFSCVYIPQVLCGYEVQIGEYVIICILSESPPLTFNACIVKLSIWSYILIQTLNHQSSSNPSFSAFLEYWHLIV